MSHLTSTKIQKKSYTRTDGTRVKAHATTVRKNLVPPTSSIKGPTAGPTKATLSTNALGIRPAEPETAAEFRARYDAELAAAETPEEWRAVAQEPASPEAYQQTKNDKALAWRDAGAFADRARLVAAGMLDEDDAEDADRETRIALASEAARPDNTAEQLAEYAKIDSDWVLDEVVRHPNTSTPTLIGLAGRDPVAALTAARRSDASSDFLAENAGSTFPNIRAAVAGHPSTPAATLRELSRDDDRDVQRALATNPGTPLSALKKLSDGSGSVAATAAWRRLRGRSV